MAEENILPYSFGLQPFTCSPQCPGTQPAPTTGTPHAGPYCPKDLLSHTYPREGPPAVPWAPRQGTFLGGEEPHGVCRRQGLVLGQPLALGLYGGTASRGGGGQSGQQGSEQWVGYTPKAQIFAHQWWASREVVFKNIQLHFGVSVVIRNNTGAMYPSVQTPQ